jgi:hypothetical protein
VLALGQVVGERNGDGWFSLADVNWLEDALRLPPQPALRGTLRRLERAKLVRSRAGDRPWALTPLGQAHVVTSLAGLDYQELASELAGTPGAVYAEMRHAVLSPKFAPLRWQPGINRLLEQFPFETNVFCMTRFPTPDAPLPDPVVNVVDALRQVGQAHGLTVHLASDRQIEDDLLGNVGAYMWACNYGVGLLEDRLGRGLNDNVLIEIGSMLVTGRRCALLKDRTSPALPTDLSAQIYKAADFDDLDAVRVAAHSWMRDDLALGSCAACAPVPTTPP